MSYNTVKNGIVNLIQVLGFRESDEAVDYKNASANEYSNTFIINATKGEQDPKDIVSTLYDKQEWKISIAFERSSFTDKVNRDEANRQKDAIIVKLDNPANWSAFVEILKYKSWELTEYASYYVLQVYIEVIDKLTY